MPQGRDERITMEPDLQRKYRAVRGQFLLQQQQFTTLRQRFYRIECAWCHRHIGWKPKRGVVPGETSHGICPACTANLLRQTHALKEALAGATRLTSYRAR